MQDLILQFYLNIIRWRGWQCCSPPRFTLVRPSKLQSSDFTRLEHRSMPRAIGTTELRLTNPALRHPDVSIASI